MQSYCPADPIEESFGRGGLAGTRDSTVLHVRRPKFRFAFVHHPQGLACRCQPQSVLLYLYYSAIVESPFPDRASQRPPTMTPNFPIDKTDVSLA